MASRRILTEVISPVEARSASELAEGQRGGLSRSGMAFDA
jgi:hypothetical protein